MKSLLEPRLPSLRRGARAVGVLLVLAAAAVRAGDDAPVSSVTDAASADEPPITAADRRYWAFRPLARPALPDVARQGWVANGIDRFVLARLEAAGLEPSPEAERQTLIRRVAFDLTGLPPAREEIERFVADRSPLAYECLVERLLASPAYGTRWGQHWLDLARFAETDGFEQDELRPNAWRYRDWVIAALNRDEPYDEFVRLQIAGDVLRPDDSAAAVATGFGLCGPDMSDINLRAERRHNVLNDLTSTVGSVFLGLQVGCAQCHDHKFDPISQADFYRLRAFFDTTELFKEQPLAGQETLGRILKEKREPAEPSHLMVRGDFRRPGPVVVPAYPRIAVGSGELAAAVPPASDSPRVRLAEWLTRDDHPLTTRVMVNRIWQHHFGEGLVRTPSDFGRMGEKPTHPELLDWLATEFVRLGWSLKRFHYLVVTSATYRQGSYAAGGRLDAGALERVPAARSRALALDPENRLLWRQNRRRLEAEVIRDTILAVSEQLSQRAGGPGVMPPLPPEIRSTVRKDHWKVSPSEEDHFRRSVYLFVRRNLRLPFLEVFDRPDTNASCARRNQTTIAPQSLALLNAPLTTEAARHFAASLQRRHPDAGFQGKVRAAVWRALGRPAAPADLAAAEVLRARVGATPHNAGGDGESGVGAGAGDGADFTALCALCRGLFSLNEFLYLD